MMITRALSRIAAIATALAAVGSIAASRAEDAPAILSTASASISRMAVADALAASAWLRHA